MNLLTKQKDSVPLSRHTLQRGESTLSLHFLSYSLSWTHSIRLLLLPHHWNKHCQCHDLPFPERGNCAKLEVPHPNSSPVWPCRSLFSWNTFFTRAGIFGFSSLRELFCTTFLRVPSSPLTLAFGMLHGLILSSVSSHSLEDFIPESERKKEKWSGLVMSNSLWPHGL